MKELIDALNPDGEKGGCAAKVAASELKAILATVSFPKAPPELLIDGRDFDDAAVYKVSETVAVVQTIDFFTPILDSPFDFGRVAAANAVSDVYAMGARPTTALAVLAFPLTEIPNSVIAEVMNGACTVLKKIGCALAGGHSIDDDTLKFGLSVNGLVHPAKIWANSGAKAGDTLILTKGLGTGTLTAALKRDALSESDIRHAVTSMATVNNIIDFIDDDLASAIHSATDITGFGFSGHAMQMAKASHVRFEIEAAQLPLLDRAEECLKLEYLTKAHRTNREYTSASINTKSLTAIQELILHDPQTSGGLLLSVAADKAQALLVKIKDAFPQAGVVGHVVEKRDVSDPCFVVAR